MAMRAFIVLTFLSVATCFVAAPVENETEAITTLAWEFVQVTSPGALAPSGVERSPLRRGDGAVAVGSRLYVIGGCDASKEPLRDFHCFNDVHVLDADMLDWSIEPVTGRGPTPRGGHTVAAGAGLDLFVFGGAGADGLPLGDVYKLDVLRQRWSSGSQVGQHVPAARTGHSSASDEQGLIYIFGGRGADGLLLNDLWVMNPYSKRSTTNLGDPGSYTFAVSWERIDTLTASTSQSEWPSPREGHSLTWVAGHEQVGTPSLVLFGGDLGDSGTAADVHVFDLARRRWSKQMPSSSQPAPRRLHSAARHGKAIVVAGGCGRASGFAVPVCHDDVWLLDLGSMEWSEGPVSDGIWPAREGHSAIFMRDQMLLVGGCGAASSCFSDLGMVDTHISCPAQCGKHGICDNGSVCRCSAGFGGHDCARKLACSVDCGRHGHCAEDGRCVCESGWAGYDCSSDVLCPGKPQKCSGHGFCLANGTCSCGAGFFGEDCSLGKAPPATATSVAGEVPASQEQCPLRCCGRGRCERGSCVCEAGWFGPGCSADASAWRSLAAARRGRRMALLQEAQGRRERADKAELLAAALVRAEALGGSTQHRLAALLADAGTLAANAATSERLAAASLVSVELPSLDTCIESAASAALIQTSANVSGDSCLTHCSAEHGLCVEGVCYCHPAYSGSTCTYKRQFRTIPRPLLAVEVVAVALALIPFSACCALRERGQKEATRAPPR